MTTFEQEFRTRRSPGISYQELLDTDTHTVPDQLRWFSPGYFGSHDVPVERYTSRAFHELEKERLWKRVWQMAGREEEIPNPGDSLVYDICDMSFLVVRTDTGAIKAYWNACLHRGRQLKETDGNVHELRCPFHGFCWNLDGSLKQVPAEWDFPHVKHDDFQLPEVHVGTWGGWIFVNPSDGEVEPLESFTEGLTEQFAPWPHERRYIQAHGAKKLRCNWKVAQEAFMEAYHVVATHPQILPGIGDQNSQYDVGKNFSRAISPNFTPSPHLNWQPTEQEMFDYAADRRLDEDPLVVIPEGQTARAVAAANAREMWRPAVGDMVDRMSDSEMNDSFYYTLFPNFHPWGAFNRITYRFRPNGDDHETSIMECYFMAPYDESQPRPAPAKTHWMELDDPWTDAAEFGMLARVFSQDVFNLPKVQKGLKAMRKPGVTLANYQESKIRHSHHLLERQLGLEPGQTMKDAGLA
jgi:phenylpropionate dioxygenase-like ring-hydroxylating dioxygenase large terminal subunit